MNRNRAVNIGLVIMVVFVVAAGASTIPVTGDLPLQTNDGFTVVLDQPGTFPGIGAFVGTDTISITSGTLTDDDTVHLIGWASCERVREGRETEVYGNPVWVVDGTDLAPPPTRDALRDIDEATRLRNDADRLETHDT